MAMDDMAVDNLPNDVKALKELLANAHKQLSKKEQKIQSLYQLLHAYQEEKRLAAARAFAPSSEQEARQYFLFNEAELGATDETSETQPDVIDVKTHQRRGGRKPLPDSLPRIEIVHDLPEDDKHCTCGCLKERIGEEVSEQLDIIPAKVRVLKHIRPKYVNTAIHRPRQPLCRHSQFPKARRAQGF